MKIRELRKLKKVSVKELSEALGVKAELIYAYEQGRVRPNTDFLKDASNYFGVSIDELIKNESNSIDNSKVVETKSDWRDELIVQLREEVQFLRSTIERLTGGLGKQFDLETGLPLSYLENGSQIKKLA